MGSLCLHKQNGARGLDGSYNLFSATNLNKDQYDTNRKCLLWTSSLVPSLAQAQGQESLFGLDICFGLLVG